MIEIPPIPASWDLVHPLVVHFPVALLLIVPIFLALALIIKNYKQCFKTLSILLMLIGTVAAYISVSSGKAAGQLVFQTPEISEALLRHQQLAEISRNIFTGLAVVYLVYFLMPFFRKRPYDEKFDLVFGILFLLIYFAGAAYISTTAHYGGVLVHQLGVKALM